MTQKQIIIKVLEEYKDWVPSYKIIKVKTYWGWLGTSSDRQARHMAEEGTIERKQVGKYAYYRIAGLRKFGESSQDWRLEKKRQLRKELEDSGQETML